MRIHFIPSLVSTLALCAPLVASPPPAPGFRHALPPPVTIVDHAAFAGLQFKAQAWYSPFYKELRCRTTATGSVTEPYSWDWHASRVVPEWEPPAFRETDAGSIGWLLAPYPDKKSIFVNLDGACLWDYAAGPNYTRTAPGILKREKFLRFTSELRQFDAMSETVTFHDVDVKPLLGDHWHTLVVREAQTVTTPSGITVTLPVQAGGLPMRKGGFFYSGPGTETWARVEVSPFGAGCTVPQSPLGAEHHRAVDVAVNGERSADEAGNVFLSLAPVKEGVTHWDTVTVIVVQSVTLQTVPLTFTVPVGPPPKNEL